MDKNKIGNREAIALIFTVMVNHTILSLCKDIVSSTGSSSLLNVVYISIIAILLAILIFIARAFK